MSWQPIETAPKDGTWVLLRGKNSVGRPMIPVVVAWTFGHSLSDSPCWRDSASLRDMTSLAASSDGAEWRHIEEGQLRGESGSTRSEGVMERSIETPN